MLGMLETKTPPDFSSTLAHEANDPSLCTSTVTGLIAAPDCSPRCQHGPRWHCLIIAEAVIYAQHYSPPNMFLSAVTTAHHVHTTIPLDNVLLHACKPSTSILNIRNVTNDQKIPKTDTKLLVTEGYPHNKNPWPHLELDTCQCTFPWLDIVVSLRPGTIPGIIPP